MPVSSPSRWLGALIGFTLAVGGLAQAPAADVLSQAHALHQQLLQTPVAERQPQDYEKIVAVLTPLWQDASAPGADSARYEAGGIYVAWARDLDDNAAYTSAAKTFLDLLHASPYTDYRRNAEWALAQIQIYHLHEPRAAAVWLRDFVQRYPADPRIALARAEIRGQRIPEPTYLEAPEPLPRLPRSTPPASAAAPQTAPSAALAPADTRGGDPDAATAPATKDLDRAFGNVSGIHVFTNPRSTSVVIALRGEVAFSRGAIAETHRVYFDISSRGAPPTRADAASTLTVEDGRVQSVRIAQNSARITRVVIVAASGRVHIDQGRFFPNPARLVISISGAATTATPGAGTAEALAPLAPAAALANGSDSLTRALGLQIHRVVLDAGHGGYDSGALGPGGLEEKAVVLDVTLRLGRLLEQRLGLEVVYTRRDDTFIPLDERTAIANRAHADLFVSIHANSNPDPGMSGIETYYLDLTDNAQARAVAARENAASGGAVHQLQDLVRQITLNDKMDESHELARDLQHSLAQSTAQADLGVKSAPFVVLIGAQMPSVLAEISFLSNPAEAQRLRQPAYRQEIAEGLYRGILRYTQSLRGSKAAVAALNR